MPRRRRNADGSLVVPLSPKQEEALAKGRRRLAELAGGAVSKETAGGGGSKETGAADEGQRSSGRRVETVRVTKASGSRSKASTTKRTKTSSRSRSSAPPPGSSSSSASEPRKGWLERWVTET